MITFANENEIEDMANEIEKRNEAFLIYQDENGIARVNVLFAFLAFVVLNCKFLHLKVYTVYLLRRFSAAKI